uniref:Uncharacterized protein n=1 Tax=Avena sativa TaxID=4498 RepID=A0ACD5YBG5_AVESA
MGSFSIAKMRGDFHLDEGLVADILARLPAKSVLRLRAVCKDWLRITLCPLFVAAHARRSPLEIFLYTTKTTVASVDLTEIDAVDFSTDDRPAPRRHLARYPAKAELPPRYGPRQYCSLLASCDGLLLLRNGNLADGDAREQYLVCNPVTRQWTDLPRLRLSRNVEVRQRGSGFYFHEPSGEYRLLCHITFTVGQRAPCYCILSTGADGPRRLSVQATPIDNRIASNLLFGNLMSPAVLHWLKHMEGGAADQMVAFDTVAETFWQMPPPPVTCREHSNLFVADGSLMASELGHLFVDLWVLDGYVCATATGEEITWERRHRVELTWHVQMSWQDDRLLLAAGGDRGDVVLGTHHGVVAYNLRSGAVRQVDRASRGDTISPSRRVFRGSLVRHGFFDARPHPGLPLFRFCA